MTKQDDIKNAIQGVIKMMMDRVMNKVLIDDPFLVDEHKAIKPLYAALVPDEIFKGSHFERRFVTPFGGVWEKLAVVVAKNGLGVGEAGKAITGKINAQRLHRIQEVLNSLEHSEKGKERIKPNWEKELNYIIEGNSSELIPVTVICDVYAENIKTDKKYAFEIKAPLPNSDQTKVSKEKILKLFSMDPRLVDEAYFALPYNPYGKRSNYSWSFPSRWFDMKEDRVVLIGDEFWEKIGGLGTYRAFIDAVNEIGPEYKQRIYREFLGIEPSPGKLEEGKL
jgi:hypothetical protein